MGEFINLLKNNAVEWNEWRRITKQIPPLRGVNFVSELMKGKKDIYDLPRFDGIDFSAVDLHMASLRNCSFENCCFDDAKITASDLVDSYFVNCAFKNVNMRLSKLGSATFDGCIFENSDLSYCSAGNTSFRNSKFIKTALEHVSFIANDFSNTELLDCSVYGISSWDLNLEGSIQKNLIITRKDQPAITVDNIELAQFLYLIINNAKLRNIIDSITSKVVLILGNFSPERKTVLDEIREKLRYYDYIPVMFDFDKPVSRSLTETIYTLAHISRFVIADLSSVQSVGHELATIIPKLPSVTFYPLLVNGDNEYAMFNDLLVYNWVRPVMTYMPNQVGDVLKKIIDEQRI